MITRTHIDPGKATLNKTMAFMRRITSKGKTCYFDSHQGKVRVCILGVR